MLCLFRALICDCVATTQYTGVLSFGLLRLIYQTSTLSYQRLEGFVMPEDSCKIGVESLTLVSRVDLDQDGL